MLSQHALQVVSQHTLQQGVPAPGLRGGLGGGDGDTCSRGGACSGGVFTSPPESRRLLLRTVRILLECILVYYSFCIIAFKSIVEFCEYLVPDEELVLSSKNIICNLN